MSDTPPAVQEFPPLVQRVAIVPMPTGFTMGYAPQQADGSGPWVMLTMSTPSGGQIYWFPVDFVDTLVESLRATQAKARGGLVVASQLLMP